MSNKDGKDYLYLIWKEPKTRRNYIVGQLSKNSQYEFSYISEIDMAMKKGFELPIPFDDRYKTYKSDTLFSTFSSRLPDSKRRDIDKILKKYDMNEFDEYKLLKRSGARLPIDSLEFVDPILEMEEYGVKRVFNVAGVRYYLGCNGTDCDKAYMLKKGNELKLVHEKTNKEDAYAIMVMDEKNNHIGYLPRYYSESVVGYLNKDFRYECEVLEVNYDRNCNECVKVRLSLYSAAAKTNSQLARIV